MPQAGPNVGFELEGSRRAAEYDNHTVAEDTGGLGILGQSFEGRCYTEAAEAPGGIVGWLQVPVQAAQVVHAVALVGEALEDSSGACLRGLIQSAGHHLEGLLVVGDSECALAVGYLFREN